MTQKYHRFRIGYARPSFLEGMARLMDVGGTLNEYDMPYLEDLRAGRVPVDLRQARRTPQSGLRSNVEAIRGYWVTAGQYFREIIGECATAGHEPSEPADIYEQP